MGKIVKILLILLLAVGVVCSCCSCVATTSAQQVEPTESTEYIISDLQYSDDYDMVLSTLNSGATDETVNNGYSDYLHDTFSSTVLTRQQWLDLLDKKLNCKDEYYRYSDLDMRSFASRQFVARTLVDMVGYDIDCFLECDDYSVINYKYQVAVALYLGYFELDEQNNFDPLGTVSFEQAESILKELSTLNTLKGKHILSFGDSIMHGDGNGYVGIAQLMAQKYMMTFKDYSMGGATFGFAQGREQISMQIQRAVANGETADFIIINGGTNDMRNVELGTISQDFDFRENGREYFSNGMEYALGLLSDYYEAVPTVYIRSHNMEFSLERNELHYGAVALSICDKWDVRVADVFSDSEFDAHDEQIKSKYTVHTKNCEKGDSVHPNRIGYYKYYIPLTVERMLEIVESE